MRCARRIVPQSPGRCKRYESGVWGVRNRLTFPGRCRTLLSMFMKQLVTGSPTPSSPRCGGFLPWQVAAAAGQGYTANRTMN